MINNKQIISEEITRKQKQNGMEETEYIYIRNYVHNEIKRKCL